MVCKLVTMPFTTAKMIDQCDVMFVLKDTNVLCVNVF